MKKVLKIIGITLLFFILIVLIHTVRNYIILSKLSNNISTYKGSNNYNAKLVTTYENGNTVTMDYYQKDNKQAMFLERNFDGEIIKLSFYDNGERVNMYTETDSTKTVVQNTESLMSIQIFNGLEFDKDNNGFTNFLISSIAFIRSEKCNNQDCYRFTNIFAMFNNDNSDTWIINKETGLPVKSLNKESTVNREYKFDCVEDSIFTEPDINEYKVNNNNNIQNSEISINVLVKEIKNEYILGTNDKNEEIIIHIDKNTQVVGLGPYAGDYIKVYTSDKTIATTHPLQVFNVTKIIIDE